MASLENIEIEDVLRADHVLLLKDSNVPVDVEVLKMLFPLLVSYHFDD